MSQDEDGGTEQGDPLIKIYDCARRFEKWDGEFVELYWDKTPKHWFRNQVVKTYLKRIEGYREIGLLGKIGPDSPYRDHTIDEDNAPNLYLQIPPSVVTEHYYKDIDKGMKTIVKKLRQRKMKEVKNFHRAHALSVPCFTWIVSDTVGGDEVEQKNDDDDDDDDDKAQTNSSDDNTMIVTSRVGGLPALFPDEPWPDKKLQFLFQINLSSIPTRMQLIMGADGLLQLFWEAEAGGGEGFARIIPSKFLNGLVLAGQTKQQQGPQQEDITAGSPKPGIITGWVERNDYCPRLLIGKRKSAALENLLDELKVRVDKFGGYGGEDPKVGDFSFQFHAFPGTMLRMETVCDCQAICVSYNPKDIHKLESGKRYHEALAFTSDF